MIIIEMILKITGWSQEELANVLGVSRVSVNCWLHGNDISLSSKKLISEKFNFPIHFFDVSLDENIEYYKIIYSVLYKNLKEFKSTDKKKLTDKEKIDDIINRIEADEKSVYDKEELNDEDIIDGLVNGYDPFTGEIFPDNHILKNKRVKAIVSSLKKYDKYPQEVVKYDELTNKQKNLFDELKEWRKEKMLDAGYKSGAYLILPDKALYNIVCADIKDKEDLLHIKGIGASKYNKYADDIYKIIKG